MEIQTPLVHICHHMKRNSGSIAPKNVSYACKVLLDCESKLFASFSLHLPFLTHTERYEC